MTETAIFTRSGVKKSAIKKFYLGGGYHRNLKGTYKNSVVPPSHIQPEISTTPLVSTNYAKIDKITSEPVQLEPNGREVISGENGKIGHDKAPGGHIKAPPGVDPFWYPPDLDGVALADWFFTEAIQYQAKPQANGSTSAEARTCKPDPQTPAPSPRAFDPYEFDELAGRLEFEAGLSRTEAEREALRRLGQPAETAA